MIPIVSNLLLKVVICQKDDGLSIVQDSSRVCKDLLDISPQDDMLATLGIQPGRDSDDFGG